MNTLIIRLEYGCFPVWIYNDNGELILNDLPWELSADQEIDEAFIEIQNIYDSLFIHDSAEAEYIGFQSESEKLDFLQIIDNAINLIKMKMGTLYVIEKRFRAHEL